MIVFIEIVLLLLTISVNAEDVIVTTKYGQVRGFPIQTTGGHKANIFLGIPYAAPPVNELRFEKPTEPEPWEGVLNATEFAPTCLPHDRTAKNNHSSEDCLYLNIIAPSKENITANKSAVMIWIHGGAYCVGGAVQYGYTGITDNFVSRDILVVTIQYRLGPYGFLSDGTSEFAGNYGLWDQSAAIKFVKENIEAFGGDPEHITLFGSSAGGGSVDAHTISPHSNKNFFASISMSGSALSPWAYGEEVVKVTKDLSNALNCTDTESKAVKSCLRAKTSDQIFDAVAKIGPSRYGFNIAPYAPRIDGDFYPKELQKLVDEAPAKPTIIGLVEKEAAFFTVEGNLPSIQQFYVNSADFELYDEKKFVKFVDEVTVPESIFLHNANSIRKLFIGHYLGNDTNLKKDYRFYLHAYTQLVSDAMFNIPCLKMKELKMNNNWPVWFYFNIHYNPDAYTRDLPVKGATHLDEYPYLFDITPYKHFDLNEADRSVQKLLLDAFTSFAKNGTPSITDVDWKAVSSEHPLQYLRISPTPEMREWLYNDTIQFYNTLAKDGYDVIHRQCFSCTNDTKDEL